MGVSLSPTADSWPLQAPATGSVSPKVHQQDWGNTLGSRHTTEALTDHSEPPADNWGEHKTDRYLPQQLGKGIHWEIFQRG